MPRETAHQAAQHATRAMELIQQGRLEDAIACYDRALEIKPDYVEALNNRGNLLLALKRFDDALASYDKALALKPDHVRALYNRGNALLALGRPAAALENYDQALSLAPSHVGSRNNRGKALLELKRLNEALESYDEALQLDPTNVEAWCNRATCLLDMGRIEDALQAIRKATALKPDSADAQSNLGAVLSAAGQTTEAIAAYERAIGSAPHLAIAHMNLGFALLRDGQYQRGWQEYEWRGLADGIPPREYPKPRWQGQPLTGKTILLYAEQGLGDAIHFARFVTVLAGQGARVIFAVHPPLVALMQSLSGVSQVIPLDTPPPPFDMYQSIMSVPGILGILPTAIPAPSPYIEPDPARTAAWRARLGAQGFKIGIVWEGKGETPMQRARSTTLAHFAGIASIDGVRLISLQKDGDISTAVFPVENLGEAFDAGPDAFLDTAAVIRNLDLVLTIDTSVAHLAGALGAPTWVAVPFAPDWRWGDRGGTNPWYPSMRVFRQPTPADWGSVFAGLESAVRERLSAYVSVSGP